MSYERWIARVLLDLAEKHGEPIEGGTRINARLTQGELAALVARGAVAGVCPSTTRRTSETRFRASTRSASRMKRHETGPERGCSRLPKSTASFRSAL